MAKGAAASSCAAADGENLPLSDDTVLETVVYEVCDTITVGPNYQVAGPNGDLTLRAGNKVALGNGSSAGVDGRLTIEIDNSLLAGMLLSISRDDAFLRTLDPQSGATLVSVVITLSGETVLGGTGLAANSTGMLFALLKLSGQAGRELVTIDSATGEATSIGDTGDKFAGLAFDSSDTLFGVTGDGAATSESLFTIDTGTASSTLVTALGNGNDGEVIGFNPLDGLLYHASGLGAQNVDEIFESIDPVGPTVTNVPLSGDDYEEALALTCCIFGNTFLLADLNKDLYTLTTSGLVTEVALLDHRSKGLAFLH